MGPHAGGPSSGGEVAQRVTGAMAGITHTTHLVIALALLTNQNPQ